MPAEFGQRLSNCIQGTAYVLSACWDRGSDYQSDRHNGILDQEVDKASLLLYQALTESRILTAPFEIITGRRGPGMGFRQLNGKPTYIGKIIRDFQKSMPSDKQLFDVGGDPQSLRYIPLVRGVDRDRIRRFADQQYCDFLNAYAALTHMLTPDEVIAIGRNIDLDWTKRAISYLVGIPGQGEQDSGVNAKTIPG